MEKTKLADGIVEENVHDADEIVFIIGGEEQIENEEENASIALNIENSFGAEPIDGFSEIAIDLLVDKIARALKSAANSQFKGTTFLEPQEVENVKKSLATEHCDNNQKAELEKELTKFQAEITSNYRQKIKECNEKKIYLEKQIGILTNIKNHLVVERLTKMLWPFNNETAKYEAKIASLKIQAAKCEQKIEAIEAMRPAAGEKDLLLFEIQLKDKFNV